MEGAFVGTELKFRIEIEGGLRCNHYERERYFVLNP
jgi:hypothetical protein